MNTKENWLIAWSVCRVTHNTMNWHPYKQTKTSLFKPRTSKEVKSILPIAKKCFITRETEIDYALKKRLHHHVKKKNYKKEWTGWKYTWVKIEEKDVPF